MRETETPYSMIAPLPLRTHTSPDFDGGSILNLFQPCKYKVKLFMFEYIKGLLPVIFTNYFLTNDDCHSYPTRSGNIFVLCDVESQQGKINEI